MLYSDYAESVEWVNMCWRKVGGVSLQRKTSVATHGGQVACNVLPGRLSRVPDRSATHSRAVSLHVQCWHAHRWQGRLLCFSGRVLLRRR